SPPAAGAEGDDDTEQEQRRRDRERIAVRSPVSATASASSFEREREKRRARKSHRATRKNPTSFEGRTIKSVLCAAVKGHQGNVIAIIQVRSCFGDAVGTLPLLEASPLLWSSLARRYCPVHQQDSK